MVFTFYLVDRVMVLLKITIKAFKHLDYLLILSYKRYMISIPKYDIVLSVVGSPMESMYADPGPMPPVIDSSLTAPVDASPSVFIQPDIPRPPRQSNAELEMAIVGKFI